MSDLSRHRPYLVWGAVLVGLTLALGVLVVPGDSWVALDQRRSSLRTTADGVAAWTRSLEDLGVPVARRYDDLVSVPPTGGGLVLLEPVVDPSAGEIGVLLEWVREGGTLVYSPHFRDELADSLGLALQVIPRDPYEPEPVRDSLVPHRWSDGLRAWLSHRAFRVVRAGRL